MKREKSPAVPKKDRLLGIEILESEDGNHRTAFDIAAGTGMDFIHIPICWDELEPSRERYQSLWIDRINTVYAPANIEIMVGLFPIDTRQERLPADLVGNPYSDREMTSRFVKAAEFILKNTQDSDVQFFAVGNEIDCFFSSSDPRWEHYIQFYAVVSQSIRELKPEIKIGVKATFEGILRDHRTWLEKLNQYSQVILVNHYPFAPATFILEKPEVVHEHFQALVDAIEDVPILFTELGYPTGADNRSSEDMQSAFVREAFSAWDKHADRIKAINFYGLTDWSPSRVACSGDYYGIATKEFQSFLGTLGFRHYFPGKGRDKTAFPVVVEEARRRGWLGPSA